MGFGSKRKRVEDHSGLRPLAALARELHGSSSPISPCEDWTAMAIPRTLLQSVGPPLCTVNDGATRPAPQFCSNTFFCVVRFEVLATRPDAADGSHRRLPALPVERMPFLAQTAQTTFREAWPLFS